MNILKSLIATLAAVVLSVSQVQAANNLGVTYSSTPTVGQPVVATGTNTAGTAQSGNALLQSITGGTAQLPHWNKALARVMSHKGNARVLLIGDSTGQGYYANNSATLAGSTNLSYISQFSNALNGIGIPSSTDNFIGFSASITDRPSTDTRMVVGSGWSTGGTCAYLGGCWATASSATGNLAYTPYNQFNTVVFWYPTASGLGTVNYNIDGGTNTGVSQNGSTAFSSTTFTTTLGNHTINFNWASGSAFVNAIETYDSTKSQVLIENAAIDGSKLAQWDITTFPYSAATACGTFAPDLIVINLMINDMDQATALSTYQSQYQGLITACQASGNTDVVLMTSNHINPADGTNPTSEATQATYAAVVRTLAATNSNSPYVTGVPVIDEFANLVSWAFQNNELAAVYDPGVYPQDLHLNYYGYGIMARDIAQALIPYGAYLNANALTNQATVAGTTSGSISVNCINNYSQVSQQSISRHCVLNFSGYVNNTATNQTFTLPGNFVNPPIITGNTTTLTITAANTTNPNATTVTITSPDSATAYNNTLIIDGN